jgi:hypothetical protein
LALKVERELDNKPLKSQVPAFPRKTSVRTVVDPNEAFTSSKPLEDSTNSNNTLLNASKKI